MKPVAIIEYGMGNLRSVANAVERLGFEAMIVHDPNELDQADKIILPGVGAFGDAMHNLRERGYLEALERNVIVDRKPFIGICLGMQLLATTGTEYGTHQGLGWIPGSVVRIECADQSLRIPHIGWNDVEIRNNNWLFTGIPDRSSFYFVHSYIVIPEDPEVIVGTTEYGIVFASALQQDNIAAVQFHPEKSQHAGLRVLKNFLTKGDLRC